MSMSRMRKRLRSARAWHRSRKWADFSTAIRGRIAENKIQLGAIMKKKLLAGAALMLLAGPALAQTGQNVDWPLYTGDVAGSKFKPLDQINASNFSKLEVAWRFKTDYMGNRPEYKLEGTPIEVGGVVYATAGSRRAVVALDAVSGELLWVHGEKEGAR